MAENGIVVDRAYYGEELFRWIANKLLGTDRILEGMEGQCQTVPPIG